METKNCVNVILPHKIPLHKKAMKRLSFIEINRLAKPERVVKELAAHWSCSVFDVN